MPLVSIIVPCYNEERTIHLLLEAIYRQTFSKHQMEVVLADGMSTDKTRAVVAEFQLAHPDLLIRLADNPRRIIPAGLNRAIEESKGEYLVRLDGHSVPADDYVERCLEALLAGKGENVGGVWEIHPGGKGWIARSIAVAAAHPLGVGDAFYRFATEAAYVDTVPFGAFRRDTLERAGNFDETLLTNEDYELNTRIRQQGGRVWLDPRIRSGYFARANLAALARQYWRYGFWKQRMLKRYPQTLRWRQALPPLFVIGLVTLSIFALFWSLARILLVSSIGLYLVILIAGAVPYVLRRKDPALLVGVPLAIKAMHLSWGCGFIYSLLRK